MIIYVYTMCIHSKSQKRESKFFTIFCHCVNMFYVSIVLKFAMCMYVCLYGWMDG